MNLLEHHGKKLLRSAGIDVPDGAVVSGADEAAAAAREIGGPVVVKAQVPSGKRGKAGAVARAETPDEAARLTSELLGRDVAGYPVERVLVERCAGTAAELYAAVLADPGAKSPVVLYSTRGGMDVEQARSSVGRLVVDIRQGLGLRAARELVAAGGESPALTGRVQERIAETLVALYRLYRDVDAELVEVNPLAVTDDGDVLALDSKITLDPGALRRHPELADVDAGPPPTGSELERRAAQQGFLFVELDGDVGVLANGAGLTMATLDAVHYFGGRPANFLEIGGDAYTKATPALALVLDNPRVRSLLVNFCGAFARTDVMTEGVIAALRELDCKLPVFFSIHGTGEAEAVAMVTQQLGIRPYPLMDDAVRAAVAAAHEQAAVSA